MKKTSVALLALLVCAAILLCACTVSFNVSTATIKDLAMTSAVDEDGKPVDTVTSYAADTPQFCASAILANAPDGTKIKFVWLYESEKIFDATLENKDSSNRYIYAYLTNEKPWQPGNYSVEVYIDDDEKSAGTIDFKVE